MRAALISGIVRMRVNSFLAENSIVLNNYLTRKEQLILLFVAGAALLGGIVLFVHRSDPELETPTTAPVVEAAPPPFPLRNRRRPRRPR